MKVRQELLKAISHRETADSPFSVLVLDDSKSGDETGSIVEGEVESKESVYDESNLLVGYYLQPFYKRISKSDRQFEAARVWKMLKEGSLPPEKPEKVISLLN